MARSLSPANWPASRCALGRGPRRCAAWLALAAALLSVDAGAENAQEVARTLFDQGRKLAADGQYEKACVKFEQSQKADPGIGTLYNLADCWEHINRTASAWKAFLDVARAAARANQAERERVARIRANDIAGKVPRLVVKVASDDDAGLELLQDGEPLDAARAATAKPMDPGEHTIAVRAPGKRNWTTKVTLYPIAKTTTVTVPKLEDSQEGESPGGGPSTGGVGPTAAGLPGYAVSPEGAVENGKEASSERPSPWTAKTIVGVTLYVGLAAGGIALGVYGANELQNKNNAADAVCPSSRGCTQADKVAYEEAIKGAKEAQAVSALGFMVGGGLVLGVVGAVLKYAADHTREGSSQSKGSTSRVLVTPVAGQDVLGASMGGTW